MAEWPAAPPEWHRSAQVARAIVLAQNPSNCIVLQLKLNTFDKGPRCEPVLPRIKAPRGPAATSMNYLVDSDTVKARVDAEFKSLDMLYDYTKFHIGVYLKLTSTYIAVTSIKVGGSEPGKNDFLYAKEELMLAVVFLFVLAGLAGGVIVSSITQYGGGTSEEFLKTDIGPWGGRQFPFALARGPGASVPFSGQGSCWRLLPSRPACGTRMRSLALNSRFFRLAQQPVSSRSRAVS